MKASVNWQDGMKFIGVGPSGFPIRMDAESTLGGSDSGVRPMELIALGLIGCQAMDVISVLQKKRQQVTGFEVKFDGPRSPDFPKVFTRASITFVVTGKQVSEDAVLRCIELAATKYCPASAMLEQVIPMDLMYEIYEDEEDGNKRLTHQGVWQGLTE
ncbi:MAG: OsmC family protein [Anaerolineae bacterium]|nr:OsmC family protein [Anaerolineae bacterium]MBL8105532.1 OsmC family protein [Anaerolineales bacterium]MCC7190168.1 OsmC family protein [Anaerolineales bacterium]